MISQSKRMPSMLAADDLDERPCFNASAGMPLMETRMYQL